MGVEVVGVGAWCDTDEPRDGVAGSTWSSEQVEQPLGASSQTLHFRVEEFATLSDGRRLTLTDDRGWSSKRSGGGAATDAWVGLTVEAVESAVRNVVLPDDAEETGELYSWTRLVERLRALGVETTLEELRRLPYEVILSRRLQVRLSATR
ncbi:hypothetical protein Franean1_3983 [Parafrankia sp. EAN1pec]|nr:hypothetical protein Franean1_3983 [Frankia sp. EAN1pec]